jgi:ubiquinone/menaquinone biosynthesis C-methylase UbiE
LIATILRLEVSLPVAAGEYMLFRVHESKIVYSQVPANSLAYTEQLDRAYSRHARLYDLSVKLLPVWKTWITAALPHLEGERVLEASFGTGYLMTRYAAGYDTYGIDFNREMIEIAEQNLRNNSVEANLQWANVEVLPFADNYFDTVINTMAFSGYPNGLKAMAEFHRVLKLGGKLVLIDFDYPADRNLFGYWLTRLMELGGDVIKDISAVLMEFPFEFSGQEIGGFGSVHLYQARKLSA